MFISSQQQTHSLNISHLHQKEVVCSTPQSLPLSHTANSVHALPSAGAVSTPNLSSLSPTAPSVYAMHQVEGASTPILFSLYLTAPSPHAMGAASTPHPLSLFSPASSPPALPLPMGVQLHSARVEQSLLLIAPFRTADLLVAMVGGSISLSPRCHLSSSSRTSHSSTTQQKTPMNLLDQRCLWRHAGERT